MTLIDKAEAQSAVRAYLVHQSTEIALHVEQIIAALPARGVGEQADAAKIIQKRIDTIIAEEGSQEPDTGEINLPEWAQTAVEELEGILAALAPTDAAHVNETPKSEHDGADVLTDAARAREAALRRVTLLEAWSVLSEAKTLRAARATLNALIGSRT